MARHLPMGHENLTAPRPLAFDHLARFPGLVHGVFPRAGGASTGPWSGLNIGMNCGDDRANVVRNRRRMLDALGVSRAVFLNQVHGNDILVLEQGRDVDPWIWDRNTGTTPRPEQADGVVTNVPGLGLVIQVADCQAVILYDPNRHVAANVHAGWRGSISNILGRCVEIMVSRFHCRPKDILAGISPSLGPCCAEFLHFEREIPETYWEYKAADRPFFDFWRMSGDQLHGTGVPRENIRSMGICTRCRPDRFFSYRAQKQTGRFGAVVALK